MLSSPLLHEFLRIDYTDFMRRRLLTRSILLVCLTASGVAAQDRPTQRMPERAPQVPKAPPRVNTAIDDALRVEARRVIDEAMRSGDPVVRANATEALKLGVGEAGGASIIAMLDDRDPLVRFAAAMACGELRLRDARPKLVALVDTETSTTVHVALRYALHRLGDFSRSHDLERYVQDPEPRVRANTVLALGLLGEKSAIGLLRPLERDRSPAVRLQSYEALWRLGDEGGLTSLVAMSISRFPDDQIVAVMALAQPRDQRIRQHVRGALTSEYAEVGLVASRAMGMLGSDEGYAVATNAVTSADPRQRALAAFALGAIGRTDAQPFLKKLLADAELPVRLASATAILSLKSA